MKLSMLLNHIQFFDTEPIQPGGNVPAVELYPGAEGMVDYECAWVADGDPDVHEHKFYVQQPFGRSGADKLANGQYMWAWDGNREAPSLTPSFKCDFNNGIVIHTYFTAGKLVDSGSENVVFL